MSLSEFDLPIQDEQAQADYTRDLLTAWFAHRATTGFTIVGLLGGLHVATRRPAGGQALERPP